MLLSVKWRYGRVLVMALAAVCLMGSFTGCSSLRRKFVRKPKVVDAKDSIVPILQPEEYESRAYSPIDRYREQYVMLKGYFGDLWMTLGRDEGGKREKFLLSQIAAKIDAMADILPVEKAGRLRVLSDKVQGEARQLDKAHAMRRYDIVSGDLKMVEREVRRQFKPEMIEKFIK